MHGAHAAIRMITGALFDRRVRRGRGEERYGNADRHQQLQDEPAGSDSIAVTADGLHLVSVSQAMYPARLEENEDACPH